MQENRCWEGYSDIDVDRKKESSGFKVSKMMRVSVSLGFASLLLDWIRRMGSIHATRNKNDAKAKVLGHSTKRKVTTPNTPTRQDFSSFSS